MSEEKELATLDDALIPADLDAETQAMLASPDASVVEAMEKAGTLILPYVILGSGSSKHVANKNVGVGEYGLVQGEKCENLGDEIDISVYAWQPKAMDTQGDVPIVTSDFNSQMFKDIKDRSRDSDSGCMWGWEFLVYLMDQHRFATFFMASASARKEAPNLQALTGKCARLTVVIAKNKKYTWPVTVSQPSDRLPDVPPTGDDLKDAATKFKQASKSDVEVVETGEERAR